MDKTETDIESLITDELRDRFEKILFEKLTVGLYNENVITYSEMNRIKEKLKDM